ncbi:adenylate kinase [Salinivirga cyanobacteriivorans]|uniref:Adenylate kinase n=1 Tax=Salinivirga cyanobacteriivorans TaxID=1307839 RepID=A0A0S2HUF4_9BACT|nr:adenylate kinase [Salinivirga cyanobacteriivorans]ALO13697.1 Adenylate kinase [Salinivirga cyanobacteriivorans]
MLNIALFGPPGAGKGTQSKMLIEKYNLTYISTGDILREEIAEGTELGLKAKTVIEKGGLASDEIIVQIIEQKIQRNPYANGFLFDGFPRTIVQAYILEGMLFKMNTRLTCMLSLEVPKNELVKRLRERGKVSGRKDDNEEVIQNRLREYDQKTIPVASFYKDKHIYYGIEGRGSVDDVFQRLDDAIKRSLEDRWVNIILFGYPGAGKGTQAKKVAEQYNLHYISTGKILRQEIRDNTDIGKLAKPYMEKGAIVPDEYAIKLIERKMEEHHKANGFIFKGFPRTMVQAYILDGMLHKVGSTVTSVFELKITATEAVKRLVDRSKTERRRPYDMQIETIISRLEEYEQRTLKAKEFYDKKHLLHVIDGIGSEDKVQERLKNEIDKVVQQTL